MAEEEKDDWLDDLDDSDDEASALDQSDIESLLSGGDEDSAVEEDVGEIDSADIDSLLSGTDTELGAQPEEAGEVAAPGEAQEEDIDQSDIDALLSEGGSAGQEEIVSAPDQNEIDMLFSEVDEGDAPESDPFQAEEIDFKDVIDSDQGDDESFLDGTGTEFDADEFGLDDDMPDLTDLSGVDDSAALFDEAGQATEASGQATVLTRADGDPGKIGGFSQKISHILASMPPALQNRKVQGIIGGCLVLLVVVGVFLFGGDEQKPQEITKQAAEQEQPVPIPQSAQLPSEQVNTPPVAKDTEVTLKEGTELAIILTAEDADGDKLSYELLSLPVHGKLSGQAPRLIYTPGKDFSGQDNFVFRVSDEKSISQPASVKISAPSVQIAAMQATKTEQTTAPAKQVIKPRKLAIAAKTKNYQLKSTEGLIIDWEELWNSANYLPFSKNVQVEIFSSKLHGEIKPQSASRSLYIPNKYYGGKENIKYRFKLGKTSSKIKELTINIALGNPPPTIKLAEMANTYLPGETAIIDAKESQDEDRGSVKFAWQQISGVPVQLQFLNKEKSQVAFVVPSSFNTVVNPGPELRLTVTDEDGQKDTQDIKVATKSRRPTAIWGGLAGGVMADEPYCPYDNSPGGLLPWALQ